MWIKNQRGKNSKKAVKFWIILNIRELNLKKNKEKGKEMQLITDGIVIKENNVGDYDRAVTVLSRDYGIIRAFSVGARRVKSRKNASTSLFAYSKFTFVKSRDTYRVEDAAPQEMFFDLRSDIVKLAVAQYICEIAQTVVPENENAEMYLRLILNTFHFLSKPESDPYLLKSIAELRFMTISGYQPDLVACRECGCFENNEIYFDILDSSIICKECLNEGYEMSNLLMLDSSLLSAIRHITYSEFNKLFNFTISPEKSRYLSSVTEKYTSVITERKYRTLDFLHSLN